MGKMERNTMCLFSRYASNIQKKKQEIMRINTKRTRTFSVITDIDMPPMYINIISIILPRVNPNGFGVFWMVCMGCFFIKARKMM